jgi:hypothetical protein
MRVGDRFNDREAEAEAVAEGLGAGAESLEGFEETWDFAGRDARAGVRDGENSATGVRASRDLDPAIEGVVPDRVRDQVCDETVE